MVIELSPQHTIPAHLADIEVVLHGPGLGGGDVVCVAVDPWFFLPASRGFSLLVVVVLLAVFSIPIPIPRVQIRPVIGRY